MKSTDIHKLREGSMRIRSSAPFAQVPRDYVSVLPVRCRPCSPEHRQLRPSKGNNRAPLPPRVNIARVRAPRRSGFQKFHALSFGSICGNIAHRAPPTFFNVCIDNSEPTEAQIALNTRLVAYMHDVRHMEVSA